MVARQLPWSHPGVKEQDAGGKSGDRDPSCLAQRRHPCRRNTGRRDARRDPPAACLIPHDLLTNAVGPGKAAGILPALLNDAPGILPVGRRRSLRAGEWLGPPPPARKDGWAPYIPAEERAICRCASNRHAPSLLRMA